LRAGRQEVTEPDDPQTKYSTHAIENGSQNSTKFHVVGVITTFAA
jgi:hypothetical protein